MNDEDFLFEEFKNHFKKSIKKLMTNIIISERYSDVLLSKKLIMFSEEENCETYLQHNLQCTFGKNNHEINMIIESEKCLRKYLNVLYEIYCQKHEEFTNTDIYLFFNENEQYINDNIKTLQTSDDAVKIIRYFGTNISQTCAQLYCWSYEPLDFKKVFTSTKGSDIVDRLIDFKPYRVGYGIKRS